MIAVETNNYRAKSTTFGIDWRSPWGTREQSEAAAKSFVESWQDVGKAVSARVFYRDGSAVSDFGVDKVRATV